MYKELTNYPGYLACSDGFVYRKKGNKRLGKTRVAGTNNIYVYLPGPDRHNFRARPLARTILETFYPNNKGKRYKIIYKDGNVKNTKLENLDWMNPESLSEYITEQEKQLDVANTRIVPTKRRTYKKRIKREKHIMGFRSVDECKDWEKLVLECVEVVDEELGVVHKSLWDAFMVHSEDLFEKLVHLKHKNKPIYFKVFGV